MASPRRAAQKCEPTLIIFISSAISRLCLNCHTGWSLVLRKQLLLYFPLCQIAKDPSNTVPSFYSGLNLQSEDSA